MVQVLNVMQLKINDLTFNIREKSTDREVIEEVVKHKAYFHGDFMVKPKDIVIDIGAHIGSFSILASSLGGVVYSYEPFSDNFDLFKQNIELNKALVYPHKLGVMEKRGERTLYIEDYNFGGTNFYNNSTGHRCLKQEEALCITLEDIYKQENLTHCDFLKVDCQGAEAEIFRSFPYIQTLKRVALEYEGIETFHELIKIFKGFNQILRIGNESGVLLFENLSPISL